MALGSTALGQESATIAGTVTDQAGATVPASIIVRNTDTGISRTITSAEDGQYVAPNLQIGHYLVRAQATGFKAGERKDLLLQAGDRTRVDFNLQVGDTKETITIEGNAVICGMEVRRGTILVR